MTTPLKDPLPDDARRMIIVGVVVMHLSGAAEDALLGVSHNCRRHQQIKPSICGLFFLLLWSLYYVYILIRDIFGHKLIEVI